jgi:hypothetical protein
LRKKDFLINVVLYEKETEENRFILLLGDCHGKIIYEELIE